MNAWIKQYLHHWVSQQGQNDWAQYLATAEYAHNSWPHNVTKKTPHELLFGSKPTVRVNDNREVRSPRAAEWLVQLQEGRLNTVEALLKCYRTKELHHQLQEGEQVWLDGRNLTLITGAKKLGPRRLGPFRITQKISLVAYRLDLPDSFKIHNIFHLDLLSPYKETAQYGPAFIAPPPELVNGRVEQEGKAILNAHKKRGGKMLQYLVSWKGFPSSENEWVDEAHMHAEHLIEQYEAVQSEKQARRDKRQARAIT